MRCVNRFRLAVTAAAILSTPAIFFMGARPCGGASITGTIIDTAADAPLGDAAISVFSYEEDWQTRPDDRGRFAISGLLTDAIHSKRAGSGRYSPVQR
jgi:hypothetical protein